MGFISNAGERMTKKWMLLLLLLMPLAAVADELRPATQAEIQLLRKGMKNKVYDANNAVFRNVTIGGGGYATNMCGQVSVRSRDGNYESFLTFLAIHVITNPKEPSVVVLIVREHYSDEVSLRQLATCEKEGRLDPKRADDDEW